MEITDSLSRKADIFKRISPRGRRPLGVVFQRFLIFSMQSEQTDNDGLTFALEKQSLHLGEPGRMTMASFSNVISTVSVTLSVSFARSSVGSTTLPSSSIFLVNVFIVFFLSKRLMIDFCIM